MSLRESPFSNGFARALHTLGWALIFPCFWFLDRLIAVCISTSLERRQRREEKCYCYLYPLKVFFSSVLFLVLFFISTPVALLGFLLWAPLQVTRRPFAYLQHVETQSRNTVWEEAGKLSLGFVTANLCLLPDSLARFNNLGHTQQRAATVGQSIVQGEGRPFNRCNQNTPLYVSTSFPASMDIVCLLEVFDKRAAAKLADALRPFFGHVLCDVGVYACQLCDVCCSFKFFNSGLFLASRHPVLKAQYHCFPNSRGEDALAAKGLLSVKVQIGLHKEKKKMVGFFNCTHLHALEGDGAIRYDQLDMVTKWIEEFQRVNRQEDEMVVFDVLCGDFNFDNCSPDDHLEQNHSLFNDYTDPCRAGPGREKPWVIGTLLQQPTLYEENVNTPDNLKMTLEDEEQRKMRLAPPVSFDAIPFVYPETGEPWVGRRIDYLLYRESTLTHHLRTEVEEFTYVTRLAGLTDHIPVGLRLNVTLDSAGDPAGTRL